jgi:hypothetical protein
MVGIRIKLKDAQVIGVSCGIGKIPKPTIASPRKASLPVNEPQGDPGDKGRRQKSKPEGGRGDDLDQK